MVSQGDILASVSKLGFSNKLTGGMGLDISFEPTIGIAAARMDKLGLDIRSFHEPLKRAVKEVMIPSIGENFDVRGRPAWPPLSEATLRIRVQRWGFDSDWPLVLTGKLRKIAKQQNIWTIDRTSAIVKDLPQQVWYGKVHQAGYDGNVGIGMNAAGEITGSGSPVSGIPARPFLVIQPEDRDAIRAVFGKWLDERVAKASWGRAQGALG